MFPQSAPAADGRQHAGHIPFWYDRPDLPWGFVRAGVKNGNNILKDVCPVAPWCIFDIG